MAVKPHLVLGQDGQGPIPTKHSLKTAKISAYVALCLHQDYAVEPGAHAGSQLERMSVQGARDLLTQMRPRGLGTALRYARAAFSSAAIMEVEHTVAESLRAWVSELGLDGVPRRGSWASLTSWANRRANLTT